MLKPKLYLVIAVLGILAVVGGACAQPALTPTPSPPPTPAPVPSPTPAPARSGTIQVYVTDAPPHEEVTSIMVTVAGVKVHKAAAEQEQEQAGSDNQTSDNQTRQGEGEWITIDISDNATSFDLLQIKGIEQFLGASEVAAGKYTQVRLVVDTIQVALGGGELQDATVPSNELKIVRPFDVVAGEATALILDFEADKMVNVTGSGKIIVKPVIKLTVRQEKPKGQQKSQKDEPKQEVTLEDTLWVLQSYGESDNLTAVLADTEITAMFDSAEEKVTGTAGCNNYFGSYEVEDSQLSIPGPIGATEMWCGEQIGEQETQYLTALQAAENYTIENGKLTITCDSQVLIFQRD